VNLPHDLTSIGKKIVEEWAIYPTFWFEFYLSSITSQLVSNEKTGMALPFLSSLDSLIQSHSPSEASFSHQCLHVLRWPFEEKDIVNARALVRMDFENNMISIVAPLSLGLSANPFEHIRYLNLRRNKIISLPDDIHLLAHLEELLLEDNKVTVLPQSLFSLALRTLSLRKNKLTSFTMTDPYPISSSIEHLDLSYNRISELKMKNLSSLRHFSATGNFLQRIPTQFCTLTRLEYLDLSANQLHSTSDDLLDEPSFPHLNTLLLSRNRLVFVPILLLSTTLRYLDINSNRLTLLPRFQSAQDVTMISHSNPLQPLKFASSIEQSIRCLNVNILGRGAEAELWLVNQLMQKLHSQDLDETISFSHFRSWTAGVFNEKLSSFNPYFQDARPLIQLNCLSALDPLSTILFPVRSKRTFIFLFLDLSNLSNVEYLDYWVRYICSLMSSYELRASVALLAFQKGPLSGAEEEILNRLESIRSIQMRAIVSETDVSSLDPLIAIIKQFYFGIAKRSEHQKNQPLQLSYPIHVESSEVVESPEIVRRMRSASIIPMSSSGSDVNTDAFSLGQIILELGSNFATVDKFHFLGWSHLVGIAAYLGIFDYEKVKEMISILLSSDAFTFCNNSGMDYNDLIILLNPHWLYRLCSLLRSNVSQQFDGRMTVGQFYLMLHQLDYGTWCFGEGDPTEVEGRSSKSVLLKLMFHLQILYPLDVQSVRYGSHAEDLSLFIPLFLPWEEPSSEQIEKFWPKQRKRSQEFARLYEFRFLPIHLFRLLLVRLSFLQSQRSLQWISGAIIVTHQARAYLSYNSSKRNLVIRFRTSSTSRQLYFLLIQLLDNLLTDHYSPQQDLIQRFIVCRHCISNFSDSPTYYPLQDCIDVFLSPNPTPFFCHEQAFTLAYIAPEISLSGPGGIQRYLLDSSQEERLLGRGGFAIVFLATLTNGKTVAVKRLHHLSEPESRLFGAMEFFHEVRPTSSSSFEGVERVAMISLSGPAPPFQYRTISTTKKTRFQDKC